MRYALEARVDVSTICIVSVRLPLPCLRDIRCDPYVYMTLCTYTHIFHMYIYIRNKKRHKRVEVQVKKKNIGNNAKPQRGGAVVLNDTNNGRTIV